MVASFHAARQQSLQLSANNGSSSGSSDTSKSHATSSSDNCLQTHDQTSVDVAGMQVNFLYSLIIASVCSKICCSYFGIFCMFISLLIPVKFFTGTVRFLTLYSKDSLY